jgi:hypothetical protein
MSRLANPRSGCGSAAPPRVTLDTAGAVHVHAAELPLEILLEEGSDGGESGVVDDQADLEILGGLARRWERPAGSRETGPPSDWLQIGAGSTEKSAVASLPIG